jgi:hypothetical protein
MMAIAVCGIESEDSVPVRDGVAQMPPRKWPGTWRVFLMGLLLGVGFLVKQHAALAVPFALFWLWRTGAKGRAVPLSLFGIGFALPILAVIIILNLQGALGDAWYWVVGYSFTGDYIAASALPPSIGEWPVLAAVYVLPIMLMFALYLRRKRPLSSKAVLLLLGLILVATVPAWPRYGRFHLQGAIPLIAIAGGVAFVWLWEEWRRVSRGGPWRTILPGVGVAAICLSGVVGVEEWVRSLIVYGQLGSPQAPYVSTAGSVRAWVDANASPGTPIFAYDLDSLIYRVLEREPTRPFVPQLPWVLSARDSEAHLWDGVASAHLPVALVPAGWWDNSASHGREQMEGMLRRSYHEGARFGLVSYPGARPVDVVGLLWDGRDGR